ncbi:MAG TPA: amidohydrolase family protein [Armatimonadota bacterium]
MFDVYNEPLPVIFDIHTHIGELPEGEEELWEFARDHHMRIAISSFDQANEFTQQPDFRKCVEYNDRAIELAKRFPGLIFPFCFVNPLYGEKAISEIRRCVGDHGMVGIKLWLGRVCTDPSVAPIIEEAISFGVPVLHHSWIREEMLAGESSPYDIAELGRRYPQLTVIMAHMGYRWRQGVAAIKDVPNVVTDCSGGDPEAGQIEYAVSMLGADRVFYGSDAPGRDVLCQVSKVTCADISSQDKEKILHKNAERLLHLL